MGYFAAVSPCASCGQIFSFHPNKVPSVVVDGVRRPICHDCVLRANPIRKERGLPEINILPGAYDAAEESELA